MPDIGYLHRGDEKIAELLERHPDPIDACDTLVAAASAVTTAHTPPTADGDVGPHTDTPLVTEGGSQEDDQQDQRESSQDDEVQADAGPSCGVRPYPTAVKLPS